MASTGTLVLLLSVLLAIAAFISVDATRQRPQQTEQRKLPYCPVNRRIKALLQENGARLSRSRSKRAVSWPHNCFHASIIQYQGTYQYIKRIEKCCRSCNFPKFSRCVAQYPRPSWRCSSDGFHCIVNCVNKHDPSNWDARSRGGPTSSNKCERTRKRALRAPCIERLCIPLK